MGEMQDFSVLMSVYLKDNHVWFKSALDSIYAQSVLPSELVMVVDGPITEQIDSVLEDFIRRAGFEVKVVRLSSNMGLGNALSTGLRHCKYDIIARMDSDDICLPNRFEKQLELMNTYDVVGTGIAEFHHAHDNVISKRIPSEDQEQLEKNAWLLCPFNHPTVMFKRAKIIEAGGYLSMHSFEDWYLWLRLFSKTNSKVFNIQEPLLAFRVSDDQYKRRSGVTYRKRELVFLKTCYDEGLISFQQFMTRQFISNVFRILPGSIFKTITKKLLRK